MMGEMSRKIICSYRRAELPWTSRGAMKSATWWRFSKPLLWGDNSDALFIFLSISPSWDSDQFISSV